MSKTNFIKIIEGDIKDINKMFKNDRIDFVVLKGQPAGFGDKKTRYKFLASLRGMMYDMAVFSSLKEAYAFLTGFKYCAYYIKNFKMR